MFHSICFFFVFFFSVPSVESFHWHFLKLRDYFYLARCSLLMSYSKMVFISVCYVFGRSYLLFNLSKNSSTSLLSLFACSYMMSDLLYKNHNNLLIGFVFQLETSWVHLGRGSLNWEKKCLHQKGLWLSLIVFSWWMIDSEGLWLLWVLPPLDRRSWVL